ncbi:tRNA (uridine(34)/cytosine(34)/5-carboxymethylaminomethyluridine(34)-2'-O)-methyltransferase TrmL [Porticoccaceae bacterium]|nr:tRNA (uridine(34)/cytosine(34)/5-carboxymethylaminomethyluridine(34)-2'-O)-methyltransferase TrmL [Porticoccaceae bacterium]MDB9805223.1 tRNA (uridine(34)/cytosine(34)/5-carboxymethylaminomethyluridine(34)-2'-O)-methyltransferase TrmL [Porticoccaceae bacterium]
MLDIVLYQPEIPPNTGNIIRLCANTGFHLHLIEPLGFDLDDKKLRRAGLDYREFQSLKVHASLEDYRQSQQPKKIYALSTKGKVGYSSARFEEGDALLFGPETRGLPEEVRDSLGTDQVLRLPMQKHSRSLNLSNTVSIIVYEAWRQLDFAGGA